MLWTLAATPIVLFAGATAAREAWEFLHVAGVAIAFGALAVVLLLGFILVDAWGTVRGEPMLLSGETLQAVGAGFEDPSAQTMIIERVLWLDVIVDVGEARHLLPTGLGLRIPEFETCRRIPVSNRLFKRVSDTTEVVLVCGANGRAVCRLRELVPKPHNGSTR